VARETSGGTDRVELPIDPSLEPTEDRRPHRRRPGPDRPRRRTRLRPGVLAAIALGGSLGGGARYLIEEAVPARAGTLPWATFSINVAGAFVLALLLVFVLEIWRPTRYVRPFGAIGFLGAFTTFSTWMLETVRLLDREPAVAVAYLAGSLLTGLAAVSLGLVLGRSIVVRRTRAAVTERG
jgi:CrcB protein